MKKLLSIGEVSKLKGVSVKSLRYYERIGVLKPAFIDEKTKYRYYDFNQLILVDIISICIVLGIPLKSLKSDKETFDNIDFERILNRGELIAKEKLKKIKDTMKIIDKLKDKVLQKDMALDSIYYRHFDVRNIMVKKLENNDFSMKKCFEIITDMFRDCESKGIATSYEGGFLYIFKNKTIHQYIFLELLDINIFSEDTIMLQNGKYICKREKGECILQDVEKPNINFVNGEHMILKTIILDDFKHINTNDFNYSFELQIYVGE